MTIDEFLVEFEKRAKEKTWKLKEKSGRIRTNDNSCLCPIEALSPGWGSYLGQSLGLDENDVTNIIRAADNLSLHLPGVTDLRSKLLAATGLANV